MALVAAGIGAGDAVTAVLIFRAVTFWTPVPLVSSPPAQCDGDSRSSRRT